MNSGISISGNVVPLGGAAHEDQEEMVSLENLSKMTGFPVDFIKSELFVNNKEISMEDLRKSMTTYLENSQFDLINS